MSNVVITGANRGIGLALASFYVRRGDTVFACCRTPSNAEALQALAETTTLSVLPLDVRDGASVAALASTQLGALSLDLALATAPARPR